MARAWPGAGSQRVLGRALQLPEHSRRFFRGRLKDTGGWLTGTTQEAAPSGSRAASPERDAAGAKVGFISRVSETLRCSYPVTTASPRGRRQRGWDRDRRPLDRDRKLVGNIFDDSLRGVANRVRRRPKRGLEAPDDGMRNRLACLRTRRRSIRFLRCDEGQRALVVARHGFF